LEFGRWRGETHAQFLKRALGEGDSRVRDVDHQVAVAGADAAVAFWRAGLVWGVERDEEGG
jgi:hypothetical protein